MEKAYGKERVGMRIDEFVKSGGKSRRDFLSEDAAAK
jgi:hypothetical protein